VAVIAKILDEHADFLRRSEVKQITFEVQRVLIGPDEMGYQVFMRRAVVENLNMLGGLDEDARMGRAEDRGAKKQESNTIAPGSFDA
jgi:hypothetical protein